MTTSYYVPGAAEKDLSKVIMSLQQAHSKTATNITDIATNTANIATNTANIATNTAAIAALQVLPYKIVAFTRDLSLASGNQSIATVGFTPRLIQFQTGIIGGGFWSSSGQADATNAGCSIEYQMASAAFYQLTFAGIQREDAAGTKYQSFTLASFDVAGFTLTWTKVSTPTVTANITATCFR